MLLLFLIRVAEWHLFGKSCSLAFPCMPFVNVSKHVYVVLSALLVLRVRCEV